jgi:DNA-binding transcriptional ArsR family regulator
MSPAAPSLDRTFQALSHPTRRAVLERLAHGPAAVSELAAPFGMALPSFLQHLDMLETGGLVTTRKRGRVRIVRLQPDTLEHAVGWLAAQRALWERRLDQLDDYLDRMEKP